MSDMNDAASVLQAAAAGDHRTHHLMRLRFARGGAPAAMMAANAFEGREALSRDLEFVVEVGRRRKLAAPSPSGYSRAARFPVSR